jgi:hypothetical protein
LNRTHVGMSEEFESDNFEIDEDKFLNWLHVFFDRSFGDPVSAYYRRIYLAAYTDGYIVGTAFLVAACLYCRFCARHSAESEKGNP